MKIGGKTRRIAVCGKGGVGKTSMTALMLKHLSGRKDLKILAVDADPAVGLAWVLDVNVKKTVNDLRNEIIEKSRDREKIARQELAEAVDYKLFDALTEGNNFAFLAIGRPESEGCYCRVNDLLKEIIESLSADFDVVLIDGEAGIEQVNRRVMKEVDDLVLVSDPSAKGVRVAEALWNLVREQNAVACSRAGLVLNRVRDGEEAKGVMERTSLELFGWIPEDERLRRQDVEGKSFLDLPDDFPAGAAVAGIMRKLGF
ncbi:MAG TPA: AAA family ATPase [Syntrophales bacterium]|nr:AAA family ATPase [Syntrophales bacterium]HQN77184.1 AAA family ATPase [Syntrophales bacterium]HQQ25949.1 AAA family ATPase [Syntrophales bacterium]